MDFRYHAVLLRARFEENRDIKDELLAKRILEEGWEEYHATRCPFPFKCKIRRIFRSQLMFRSYGTGRCGIRKGRSYLRYRKFVCIRNYFNLDLKSARMCYFYLLSYCQFLTSLLFLLPVSLHCNQSGLMVTTEKSFQKFSQLY